MQKQLQIFTSRGIFLNLYNKVYNTVINFIYPSVCFVCKKYIQGNYDAICPDCWMLLKPPPTPYCSCCQISIPGSIGYNISSLYVLENKQTSVKSSPLLCFVCKSKSKPYFDSCRSIWLYDDRTIKSLILAFKHGDKTQLAVFFARAMISYWESYILQFDVIVPVPIHNFRLLKRLYNQASLLAYQLNKICKIPYNNNVLLRNKNTPSLGKYSYVARKKVLNRAFSINDKLKSIIVGKRVLLIDDVMTTGQTLNQCAKTLKKAGALYVGAIMVAKNKRPIKVN